MCHHPFAPTQTNWRLRVARELSTGKYWAETWGFLADETPGRGQDALDTFRSGPAFQSVVGLALKPDVQERLERTRSQGDSLDSFVRLHLVRQNGREMRCAAPLCLRALARWRRPHLALGASGVTCRHVCDATWCGGRMLPKAEFSRPLLTSHQIGWGSNLEVRRLPLRRKSMMSACIRRWRLIPAL